MLYERYLQDLLKNIKKITNLEVSRIGDHHMLILGVVLYILLVTQYKPAHLINFIKKPIIQVVVLVSIFYLYNKNPIMSIALVVAFVFTVSNNTEPESVNYLPIINKTEGFTGHKDDEDSSSEEEDSDSEDEEDSSSEEEEEDSDEEDSSSVDFTENFSSGNIVKKNPINDSFKNLHDTIHRLENFINTKSNK